MENRGLVIRQEAAVAVQPPDVMSLASAFVASGYFKDAKDQAQAVVKILYGQEIGIGPVSAMMNIHVIDGKPAMSSNLMAALIKRSGRYNFTVLQSDAEGCVLEFFDNGKSIGRASYTKADATAAQVLGKDNWRKYPKAMMFARAVSQGARMFAADVFLGAIYVAEELGAEVNEQGEIIEAEASTPVEHQHTSEPAPKPVGKAQISDIIQLAKRADMPVAGLCDSLGISELSVLSEKRAAKLIQRLQAIVTEKEYGPPPAAASGEDGDEWATLQEPNEEPAEAGGRATAR